jgi:hypothetical protein
MTDIAHVPSVVLIFNHHHDEGRLHVLGNGDQLKEDVFFAGDFSWDFIKDATIKNGFFRHVLEKACCVPR